MADRNSFILSHSFKHFFTASILVAVAEQACLILDMILVGNFVSADAFAAMDIAVPLEAAITGLLLLLAGGAGNLASRYIGNQDFRSADRAMSLSVYSSAAVALILSAVLLSCLDGITSLLCGDTRLAPYLHDYLEVYLLGLLPMALYYSLSELVDIEGKPALVTVAVYAGCAADLILDVVFMKYMGMGVAGQAYASIVSYIVPVLTYIPFLCGKRCRFRFKNPFIKVSGSLLKDNIEYGVPYCLPYLMTFLFGVVLNAIVLNRYGASGLYVWGVAYQILSIGFLILDSTRNVLVTLGSMLYGSSDFDGLKYLTRKCLSCSLMLTVPLTVVVCIYPTTFITLFGESSQENFAGYLGLFRTSLVFLLPFTYCSIRSYLNQILERKNQAILQICSLIGLTLAGVALADFLRADNIFIAVPAAAAVYLLLDHLVTVLKWKKHPELSIFMLIPNRSGLDHLHISVPYSDRKLSSALGEVESFLDKLDISPAVGMNVNLCCEELMLNIMQHNTDKVSDGYFFDLIIMKGQNEIKVRLIDAGEPFNPISHDSRNAAEAMMEGEDVNLSLQLLNAVCKDLEYNYMYGQNTVYMAFPLGD